MADPIVKYAEFTAVGDGVKTVWDFNFAGAENTPGYISISHVKAFTVNPAGLRSDIVIQPAMWVSATSIRITPAVAAGTVLTIYRDTPKDKPLVNYTTNGIITEANLDTTARQAIYVAAEVLDSFAEAQEVVDGIGESVSAAAASAAASLVSENAAAAAESAAESAAAAADADRIAAAGSATTASTAAGVATGAATTATTALSNFEKRYLGAKATSPTVDNAGLPLTAGALYFSTTANQMLVYSTLSNTWGPLTNSTILNGTVAPTSAVGFPGDFYINTVDYLIYGPKVGTAWGAPRSLIGPGGSGSGNVSGPASSADSQLVLFNGTNGTVIKAAALTANVMKVVAGAPEAAVAGTDYVAPGRVITSGATTVAGRILGRTTGGVGAVEELSVGSNLTLSGGVLNAVTSGLTPIATLVPTGAAIVQSLASFGGFDAVLIIASGLKPASNANLRARLSVAGVVDSGTNYTNVGGAGSTLAYIDMTTQATTTVGGGLNTRLEINNVSGPIKGVSASGTHQVGAAYSTVLASAVHAPANTVDGISFFWSGGENFVPGGVIRVYGYKN